jgi:hypothetical protein
VLGDFYLQPLRWIEDRRRRAFRSPWLYAHALVHGALAWIAIGSEAGWTIAAGITGTHALMDGVKSWRDPRGTSTAWFVADQAAHLAVAVTAAGVGASGWSEPGAIVRGASVVALAVLAVTRPVGFFVATFTQRWSAELGERTDNLPGAGMWIGVIERALILVFVLTGSLEAVGFLLAAKSVFRFGDLRDGTDRKRTEYVLVGTLLSFGIAIGTALLARALLTG